MSTKINDVYCIIIFLNLTWFDSLQKNWEFLGAFQKQVKVERPLQHWKIFGNRFLLLTRPGNRMRWGTHSYFHPTGCKILQIFLKLLNDYIIDDYFDKIILIFESIFLSSLTRIKTFLTTFLTIFANPLSTKWIFLGISIESEMSRSFLKNVPETCLSKSRSVGKALRHLIVFRKSWIWEISCFRWKIRM